MSSEPATEEPVPEGTTTVTFSSTDRDVNVPFENGIEFLFENLYRLANVKLEIQGGDITGSVIYDNRTIPTLPPQASRRKGRPPNNKRFKRGEKISVGFNPDTDEAFDLFIEKTILDGAEEDGNKLVVTIAEEGRGTPTPAQARSTSTTRTAEISAEPVDSSSSNMWMILGITTGVLVLLLLLLFVYYRFYKKA